MSQGAEFPHLKAAAHRLEGQTGNLTLVRLRELLCHDCEFWHDDHEEDLECSCFRMLRILLKQGILTPAQLSGAVNAGNEPDAGGR